MNKKQKLTWATESVIRGQPRHKLHLALSFTPMPVISWPNARSWGASTPMKMCIQADLDDADALRHMNKNNSERAVCITHPLAPISTSFLFVFDTEWVMST